MEQPTKAQETPRPNTVHRILRERSSPDWKPEPCGLSREEVRRIIAEQLG